MPSEVKEGKSTKIWVRYNVKQESEAGSAAIRLTLSLFESVTLQFPSLLPLIKGVSRIKLSFAKRVFCGHFDEECKRRVNEEWCQIGKRNEVKRGIVNSDKLCDT